MKKSRKIILIVIVILLILLLLIIPSVITIIAYNSNFNLRVSTSSGPTSLKFEDYPNMKRTSVEFSSNQGQILKGYVYETKETSEAKALIVFSHGYLGTHTDYLNQIHYFVENGYKVLGFDNTGSGISGGNSLIGLAQSPIDLDYALRFVENNPDLNQYKILLYGHSWGGYAVCAVLNYNHNVTAVVSRSGFSNSRDMLVEYGSRLYGDWLSILSPYVYIYEKTKFGNSIDLNGVKGINHSTCDILLLHSEDDPVISLKNSLLTHKNEYKSPERIQTILYSNKGHDVVMSDASNSYVEEQDKRLINELDQNVMKEILDFYENSIQKD